MLYELYNILTNYTILIEEHLKHLHRVAEKKCFCLSVKGGESEGVTNPQHPPPPPPPPRRGLSNPPRCITSWCSQFPVPTIPPYDRGLLLVFEVQLSTSK